jgi:hypothetical protein
MPVALLPILLILCWERLVRCPHFLLQFRRIVELQQLLAPMGLLVTVAPTRMLFAQVHHVLAMVASVAIIFLPSIPSGTLSSSSTGSLRQSNCFCRYCNYHSLQNSVITSIAKADGECYYCILSLA